MCISGLIFLFTFNSLYDMENKIKFCLLDGKASQNPTKPNRFKRGWDASNILFCNIWPHMPAVAENHLKNAAGLIMCVAGAIIRNVRGWGVSLVNGCVSPEQCHEVRVLSYPFSPQGSCFYTQGWNCASGHFFMNITCGYNLEKCICKFFKYRRVIEGKLSLQRYEMLTEELFSK